MSLVSFRFRTSLLALLIAVLGLSACDTLEVVDPPVDPVDPVDPDPDPEPTRDVETWSITGVQPYGVGADTTGYVVADTLRYGFRFGVYATLEKLTDCRPGVDICAMDVVDEVLDAEVLLDTDVTVNGGVFSAGTDLAFHFDFFEAGFLRVPLDVPFPLYNVAFDPSEVSIPAGEHVLTIRWTLDTGEVFEGSATVVYDL